MADTDYRCGCRKCGSCANRASERGWFQCRPCSKGWHSAKPCSDFATDAAEFHRNRPDSTCGRCGHAKGEH